jgi:hypothetical protein
MMAVPVVLWGLKGSARSQRNRKPRRVMLRSVASDTMEMLR